MSDEETFILRPTDWNSGKRHKRNNQAKTINFILAP